ncbi:MAG: hypothetical protein AYK19_09200 [Theionarchaea archaeon DG-70-1]|nr:MAG: hypothetical protein AYK19_09200 [Theionarchaea archaeon DG-70-1]
MNDVDYEPCTRNYKIVPKRGFYALKRRMSTKSVNMISYGIAFVLVISLLTPFLVKANPGLTVQVPQSPLAPNQPVYIEYFTNMGEDGTIQMDITKPPLLAIFWQSGPMPITGGLLNSITAPGFSDPGTYVVSASVTLAGGGGTIHGSTTFEVLAGGQPGQPPGGPGFDFHMEVMPPVTEVERGEPAHYEIIVHYSDPSYSGIPINIHVTGLGPGMQWHTTPMGQLTITTSHETPPGDYMFEIVGEAQGVVHQVVATLIVRERPEEHPPEPPPEEPPPEEHPEEHPPEPPPEEPPPEEHPPEHEEYPPYEPEPERWEGQYPEESGLTALFSNPLYLIIAALVVIIILLIIALMRRTS